MKHKQKRISINGKRFMCDLKLIPLIKELNKLGLKTSQCCQGGKNKTAYLSLRLDGVYDVTLRDFGKRLVLWWFPKEYNSKSEYPIQDWTSELEKKKESKGKNVKKLIVRLIMVFALITFPAVYLTMLFSCWLVDISCPAKELFKEVIDGIIGG